MAENDTRNDSNGITQHRASLNVEDATRPRTNDLDLAAQVDSSYVAGSPIVGAEGDFREPVKAEA